VVAAAGTRSTTGRVLRLKARPPNPIESPAIGHALQLVLADVLERQPAPGDEVFDGLGHQDFGGAGQAAHAGSDVDGDASDLAVNDIALAGVEPGADLDSEWSYRIGNRSGTADRPGGRQSPRE
jgi:hypothetical protein